MLILITHVTFGTDPGDKLIGGSPWTDSAKDKLLSLVSNLAISYIVSANFESAC